MGFYYCTQHVELLRVFGGCFFSCVAVLCFRHIVLFISLDQRPQPCVCVAVNVLEIHNTDNTCSSCSCAVFVYSLSALNITSVFIRLLFFPVLVLFPLSLFAVSSITYLSLHNMHPNNLFTSRDVVIQAAALRLLCSTVRRPPLNKDHWLQYHIDTDD